MTSGTVVLIALRGDVHCLDRQLAFQGLNRDSIYLYNVVIIGDVWGANNLVCTPQQHTQGHSEMALTNIVLSLVNRKEQWLKIVPGQIDIAIMKQPGSRRFLLSGSRHNQSALLRTLKKNMRTLLSVMHSTLQAPLTVERTTAHLPQVRELCKNLPPVVWPTAFVVNGELCQPMIASCYHGINGMELHGLLGDAVQNAIRQVRHKKKDPVKEFILSAIDNGSLKISAHHTEQEQLEQTSICFRHLDIHQVNMLRDWRGKRLNWPRWKTEFVSRFGADIGRLGKVPKESVHSALDRIMGQ